jgi:CheY-like chemotaxis protein
LPPPRILIVDDDTIITHLISTMLQKKGYNIVGIITSGEEAIIRSAELNPDLVIMDIRLAGKLDGMDAARYIFQLFHYPIIFITGISDEEHLKCAKYSQPYGIVFKPFTPVEISTNVDLALYNHNNRGKHLNTYPAGDPKKMMDAMEAVIVADKRGRIIFFNTYGAWFVDIPRDKLMMRHWRDAFMLINDQTGEELKDAVAEATQQMACITLTTNTALVTTNGKRRKVNFSVRPLKDDHDRFLAVLISVREKTSSSGK